MNGSCLLDERHLADPCLQMRDKYLDSEHVLQLCPFYQRAEAWTQVATLEAKLGGAKRDLRETAQFIWTININVRLGAVEEEEEEQLLSRQFPPVCVYHNQSHLQRPCLYWKDKCGWPRVPRHAGSLFRRNTVRRVRADRVMMVPTYGWGLVGVVYCVVICCVMNLQTFAVLHPQ